MNTYPGMGQYADEFMALSDALVPASGHAVTLQGELVRAVGNLASEWRRNGNMNWEQSYDHFKFFCDLIAQHVCSPSSPIPKMHQYMIALSLKAIAANGLDAEVGIDESHYDPITDGVVLWCRAHPDPIPYSPA